MGRDSLAAFSFEPGKFFSEGSILAQELPVFAE